MNHVLGGSLHFHMSGLSIAQQPTLMRQWQPMMSCKHINQPWCWCRLSPGVSRPDWYTPVDAEEERRRWA